MRLLCSRETMNKYISNLNKPLSDDEKENINEAYEFARIWTMIRIMRRRVGIDNPEPESDFWCN